MATALAIMLALTMIAGVVVVLKFHYDNRDLRAKLGAVEQKISTSVEERLLNHTKYCATFDALVKHHLEAEEKKWRELLAVATCRFTAECDVGFVKMTQDLEKVMMNFKSLLEQSYLDEYEKMRKNPPRPKKGPRKKIDPPQRYRSLDDEFNC